jgi:hypothetical protein
LVGVAVGDGLAPHPPRLKDARISVLETNVSINADSAVRHVRRAAGVRSINLSPPGTSV